MPRGGGQGRKGGGRKRAGRKAASARRPNVAPARGKARGGTKQASGETAIGRGGGSRAPF